MSNLNKFVFEKCERLKSQYTCISDCGQLEGEGGGFYFTFCIENNISLHIMFCFNKENFFSIKTDYFNILIVNHFTNNLLGIKLHKQTFLRKFFL